MNAEYKEFIRSKIRYKSFTFVEGDPIPFDELFKDIDIPVVQLHDAGLVFEDGRPLSEEDIIGFAGAFSWKDNKITSLDGDCYNKSAPVIAYEWFLNRNKERCLDILVSGSKW